MDDAEFLRGGKYSFPLQTVDELLETWAMRQGARIEAAEAKRVAALRWERACALQIKAETAYWTAKHKADAKESAE